MVCSEKQNRRAKGAASRDGKQRSRTAVQKARQAGMASRETEPPYQRGGKQAWQAEKQNRRAKGAASRGGA